LRASAQDIAILAQTFLNGGTYNKFQLLSPATVVQMTTNQIPGVGTEFNGWHDEASWAYGWRVLGTDRWKGFDGVLRSMGSYDHGGAGGNMVWVDPARNLVGVYLSAYLDCEEDSDEQMFGEIDLYQDMITAACY
jgi:CubicO group peptidase (beta-lactamase class C family)